MHVLGTGSGVIAQMTTIGAGSHDSARRAFFWPLPPKSKAVPFLLLQTLTINPNKRDIDSFTADDFTISGYSPYKKIAMTMAV